MGAEYKHYAMALAERAAPTRGYFTAAMAREAGYADSVHAYHVRNGDWEKAYRGIYRLAGEPETPFGELIIWSIWSRNRAGDPQGVYTGETARWILGLRERPPGPLEMTVPPGFRKNCEVPERLRLIKEAIPAEEIRLKDGIFVHAPDRSAPVPASAVNPARSWDDVIDAGED